MNILPVAYQQGPMDINEQINLFQQFIEINYYDHLIEAIQKGHTHLVIDFSILSMYNIDLAQQFLDKPEEMFEIGQIAVERFGLKKNTKNFFIRVKNLPSSQEIMIRNIRSEHIGRLIQIVGVVRQKGDVRPHVINAKFECPSCGNVANVIQNDQKFKEPPNCACGRKGGFKLLNKDLVDVQKIVLEESTEELDGGEQPKRFNLLLRQDLVTPISEKKTNPGNKIIVTGIVNDIPINLHSGGKSVEFDLMLESNYIEPLQEEFSALKISKEQEEEIFEFARTSENPLRRIADSFAPTIYGYEKLKEGLVLQMMGGVMKPRSDGVKTRGDIHVLLIGDPGAAKSQLLKRVSKIAPKARFVSGKGASGAGLTASVVKDDFLKGWALEAGTLVLANQGIACIDELDKMTDEDRSAMHEALEQQTITISKANIQATLRSETTVLAAANPKFGRFDPYEQLGKQIDLPPALISRFDLIFPVRDIPNKDKDEKIANFILKLHQDITRSEDVDLSTDFIKTYIAYAKRNINPKLTDEALMEIQNYYVTIRNSGSDGSEGIKAVPITARQLEALVRLAEASARVRLSKEVSKHDAKIAIELLHYALGQIGADPETGKFDIDRITTGITASQRNHISVVKDVINKLAKEKGEEIPEDEIIIDCEAKGIEESKVEEVLEKLKRTGDIYQPKRGFYSKTR